MKIAVIAFTTNGVNIAQKLRNELNEETEIFIYEKYCPSDENSFSSASALIRNIWNSFDGFIFISACGIAVRLIAPYIISKNIDPAVVVIDESGRFSVPILSGHIGGANELAVKAASIIGAVPVLTTATDSGGRFSPDCFAIANDLFITDLDAAKRIAAASVRGEQIGICGDYPVSGLPEHMSIDSGKYGICITDDISRHPYDETLILVPKNIVIGFGCKKNTDPVLFEQFILSSLEKNIIPLYKVRYAATVDIKKEENAILLFCRKYRIPLRTYSPERLMHTKGSFSSSEFVMKTVGCDNVCERSAAADGGNIIVKKTSENGMTFAAAELDTEIRFDWSAP